MLGKIQIRTLIGALILSTILVIVLLALGITTVYVEEAYFTFGLLGFFAVALAASENTALHARLLNTQSSNENQGRHDLYLHHRFHMWLYEALFVAILVVSFFIAADILVLGLIPLWFLSFLIFAILIDLL